METKKQSQKIAQNLNHFLNPQDYQRNSVSLSSKYLNSEDKIYNRNPIFLKQEQMVKQFIHHPEE